ncbi:hypothetical protein DHEL01_v205000 [Diaporthe helianthi]|uniref:Uncharacterized protein n=1 Tax=Diaporthe helianthi TaxID=158607 RepID=A0A2P5I2B5_DIAHE|nr:hypothetical protein DHEL01_v205000 [Diaporthe helianthi]
MPPDKPPDKAARKPLPNARPAWSIAASKPGHTASQGNNQSKTSLSTDTPRRPSRGNTGDPEHQSSPSHQQPTISPSSDGISIGQNLDDDIIIISSNKVTASNLTTDPQNKSLAPKPDGASAPTLSHKRDHNTMTNPSTPVKNTGSSNIAQASSISQSHTGDVSSQPSQQTNQPKLVCPIHDCPWEDLRLQPLYDHLAEKHGYERAEKEYTVNMKHLKRKNIKILKVLLIRDARKLAWSKARLLASEEAIKQTDPSYVSRHGLGLTMEAYLDSIQELNAADRNKKDPLKAMLVAVREEMGQKGQLYNQASAAHSSWGQVYDDLVSTFHLSRVGVDQRAEHHFHQLRVALGDDMTQNVTPAQVELTDQLQLKAGASLPRK